MRIFIDTNSNWNGGYLAHLKGFLSSNVVKDSNIEFIVYGNERLHKEIRPLHNNIIYKIDNTLPTGYYKMNSWRKNKLPAILKKYQPDVHFNPMGWIADKHKICSIVTMSKNLQPFIKDEIKRINLFSTERLRLNLAKNAMVNSFNLADGLIFLSEYAKEIILPFLISSIKTTLIPHGVNDNFRQTIDKINTKINLNDKINLLYVSRVFTYKNHDNVILAIEYLRQKLKLKLNLTIIGGVSKEASSHIKRVLKQVVDKSWLNIFDSIPNYELPKTYHSSDIFIFASSVENCPTILLEAMASGLPIVYAKKRPMTDILGEYGLCFNPLDYKSIAIAIEKLLYNDKLRFQIAANALQESSKYSYEIMSSNTIHFLSKFG